MEIKGKVSLIIGVIVALVVLVTVLGSTASTVNTAGAQTNQSNRCAAAGCVYNATGTPSLCQVSAASGAACATTSANNALPLEGLFNSGGIIVLLFIAAGLILAIGVAMKMSGKK